MPAEQDLGQDASFDCSEPKADTDVSGGHVPRSLERHALWFLEPPTLPQYIDKQGVKRAGFHSGARHINRKQT